MASQFGQRIRELRTQNNLLLRQVASTINIDTALLSKIERGERPLKKEQIISLAKLFKVPTNELKTLWLADQLYNVIEGEPMADEALKSVSKKSKKEK